MSTIIVPIITFRCHQGIHVWAYARRYNHPMRQCIVCGNNLPGDY